MTNPVQYSELDKFLPAEDDLIEFFGKDLEVEPEEPFLDDPLDDEDDFDDEDDSDDEDDEDFED